MPIPVISIIGGGHAGCGKLRFREFCLTPLPGSTFPEQAKALVTIYQELGKVLASKFGVSPFVDCVLGLNVVGHCKIELAVITFS